MSFRHTPVLMYHHIEPMPLVPKPKHVGSYLPRSEFGRQLDWLAKRGFRTVTLAESLGSKRAAGARGATGARPAWPRKREIVLTFDDACKCFLDHALEELEERRMTATVFAVSSAVGGTNTWDDRNGERTEELMTADDLRLISHRGIEVGSHSRSHADLSNTDHATCKLEIAGSKHEIEQILGSPVDTFCYPYAHFDQAAIEAVQAAGYLGAVSAYGEPGASSRQAHVLARAVVRPGNSRLEFRLQASGWYRVWRLIPRVGFLRSLRRMKSK